MMFSVRLDSLIHAMTLGRGYYACGSSVARIDKKKPIGEIGEEKGREAAKRAIRIITKLGVNNAAQKISKQESSSREHQN